MNNLFKIFLLSTLITITGCGKHHLVVNHPTIMVHGKGHDEAIGGVAVSIRVKWDVIKN